MRVLLLGANGRLGRRLVPALSASGHIATAFVRDSSRLTADVSLSPHCARVVQGDARSASEIAAMLRNTDSDGIVNAAGYTPMAPWADFSDYVVVFRAVLDAAEAVGKERKEEGRERIRVWMMSDLNVMDAPWGGLLQTSLPPIFPVHRSTYPILIERSTDDVAWSLMCPAEMVPGREETDALRKRVDFSGPIPPSWSPILLWFPLLGKHINAMVNGLQMQTTYAAVAEFIAKDLELGLESGLIGMKVAPRETA